MANSVFSDLSRSELSPLQALSPEELAGLAAIELGEARKLVSLVHRLGALPGHAPAGVRRESFQRALAVTFLPRFRHVVRTPSEIDPFVKYTVETHDGAIETVRIPLERAGRMSVCVSSQVGCALACSFCATGRMGLQRNLDAWEIVEQVRLVRAELPEKTRIHGVVFQGMGEPLANLAQVVRAARIFSDPSAQAIDARNITVSTAGLPAGIRALGAALPHARLALSIASARRGRRQSLMPIDIAHPLDKVLVAAGEHARATGLSPLFAYTLLAGQNDSPDDARALAALVLDFGARYGRRPRLSLIAYNAIGGDDPYLRTAPPVEEQFRQALIAAGVIPTHRYSGGSDVGAACGQLAGRSNRSTGNLSGVDD